MVFFPLRPEIRACVAKRVMAVPIVQGAYLGQGRERKQYATHID
jgi:hypothetical protein